MSLWRILPSNKNIRREISDVLGLNPLLAHLLTVRGIKNPIEARRFLEPKLEFLNPPLVFSGMEKAVAMIKRAIESKERILIHGDYDADGVTASALLYSCLSKLGADAKVFLPHRINDGYGLSVAGINKAIEMDCRLLITVDCGISSFEEVHYAMEKGLKVIITDHHLPSQRGVPDADVVINPKLKDCPYPFKELSGVGIAFKLAHALLGNDAYEYLGLAALGTVADVVPIIDENRIIVKKGMEKISRSPIPGIKALLQKASVRRINTKAIGFMLAPKINAAGRIGSAEKALNLLINNDYEKAGMIAEELIYDNRQRQKIEESILKEAIMMAEAQRENGAIVLYGEDWHPGVIGIIASRITDKFKRPSFIISIDGDKGKGSARSIAGINLKRALEECEDTLLEFGGHSGAAGFSIEKDKIPAFTEKISRICESIEDAGEDILWIDARVSLSMLNYPVVESLSMLAPFGEGNPRPRFVAQNLELKGPIKTMAKNSIRFIASDGNINMPVVGFGKAEIKGLLETVGKFDMAFSASINEYNGISSLQAELIDIKVAKNAQNA